MKNIRFDTRLLVWAALLGLAGGFASGAAEKNSVQTTKLSILKESDAVVVQNSQGSTLLRYQLQQPLGLPLSVESACYFHPFTTPKGIVVTDVAPEDHRHHRGIFLAWVEMHGQADADFWGWGEHAPTKERRISNKGISKLRSRGHRAAFAARNEWNAADQTIIQETLEAEVRSMAPANVLDLVYRLTPAADVTLSRWAFSGFCLRTRKEGQIEAFGPDGPVALPNPRHTEPATDWPSALWYGYRLDLPEGTASIAVIDHPQNPQALWHNHRETRMLNPCIVAPQTLGLRAKQPLVLKYRVVAMDGPFSQSLVNELAGEFARKP